MMVSSLDMAMLPVRVDSARTEHDGLALSSHHAIWVIEPRTASPAHPRTPTVGGVDDERQASQGGLDNSAWRAPTTPPPCAGGCTANGSSLTGACGALALSSKWTS